MYLKTQGPEGVGPTDLHHLFIHTANIYCTECFYLPGTTRDPGETSGNKTRSLLTVLMA